MQIKFIMFFPLPSPLPPKLCPFLFSPSTLSPSLLYTLPPSFLFLLILLLLLPLSILIFFYFFTRSKLKDFIKNPYATPC